jgi:hypothetical protein
VGKQINLEKLKQSALGIPYIEGELHKEKGRATGNVNNEY